jgi:CheY-like chemotaxis protein
MLMKQLRAVEHEPDDQALGSILVVDDNRDAANTLRLLLRRWGYDAHVSYSGHQALDAVEMEWPRLVILDISMPLMSGYELARRLRDHAGDRALTIWALTALGDEVSRNHALANGIDRHFTKPIKAFELQRLLLAELGPLNAEDSESPPD